MRNGFAFRRRRLAVLTCGMLVALLVTSMLLVFKSVHAASTTDISSNYAWKPLKTGGGGFITGLVIHPTAPGIMYARSDVGGAYRWNAQTQSWQQMLLGNNVPGPVINDYGVESIALSAKASNIVYMAVGNDVTTSSGRILKSTNYGKSWTDSGYRWPIAGNGDDRQGGERLAVDPNNNNVVYFGSRTEGLWVSTNAAKTWTQVSPSLLPVGVNSGSGTPDGVKFVQFDSTSPLLNGKTSRIFVGVAGKGVYRSEDAGKTWILILATTDIPYDNALASDDTLYVAIISRVGQGAVEKYNVATNTWTVITPPAWDSCYDLALDPFNAQRLFTASCGLRNGHFWRSSDGGTSWDTLNVTLSSANIPWILNTDEANWLSLGRLVFDPLVPNELWFAQGTGVWQATNLSDATINWNFKSNGIEEVVANDVIAPPGGKPITVNQDRNGFYHANPDAYPQQPILTSKFSDGTSLDYSGGTPGFVVAASCDTRNLNPCQSGYSSDGGQSWTEFSGMGNYPDLYGGDIAVSATNTNDIVWLPTWQKQPYVTTDRGATWTKIASFNNVTGLHTMIWWGWKKALDSDKVNGNFYIYSTENGGEFYVSTDGGQTFTKARGQAPPSTGNDAHVFGQVRSEPGMANTVWASVAQGGLWYTPDAGTTWTQINGVQQARSFGFGAPIGGSQYPTVYLYGQITDQWGVWRSTDQGASWAKLAQYPLNLYDQVLTVNGDMSIPGRVYVGFSGNGFAYGDDKHLPKTPTPTPTSPVTPTATATASATPTSTPTGGVALNPIADRDNYASHTGSETLLDISIYQTAYIKFDLSSLGSTINSAHFRVYRNNADQGSITITAYQVSDNSWVENSNVLPALGNTISTQTSPGSGYVDFDVTSYIQSAKASGSLVTIAINASCASWQDVFSRENGTNEPELIVS